MYREKNISALFLISLNHPVIISFLKIYWTHSATRVLTMEFIGGLKVLELDALRARGIDPKEVVKLIARTYLKQLLEDGFFHADPHPGNLLVMTDGRLAFFDFGMVGRITPELQAKMIDAFFHVVARTRAGIAQDLIDLDFLKPGTNPNSSAGGRKDVRVPSQPQAQGRQFQGADL